MSTRSRFPAPRPSSSHYFISISRGDRIRQISLKPWVIGMLGVIAPLSMVGFVGATAYVAFYDDMIGSMLSRQSEMQYSYEDRLAGLRAQLDRVTSRQLLDQDTLEGRVHQLISRQAQIENRASVIAILADQAGVSRETTSSIAKPEVRPQANSAKAINNGRGANPLLTQPSTTALPPGVSAYAPFAPTQPLSGRPEHAEKPRPEILDQRSSLDQRNSLANDRLMALAANTDMPVDARLHAIGGSLDNLELSQVSVVSAMGSAARQTVSRLRTAINELGLPADRLAQAPLTGREPATGGPFVPIKADPRGSPFEREVYRLQNDFLAAGRLKKVVQTLPLRQPLNGALDVTSPFGGRADPFFGRLATHTGIDLRDPQGTPVRTTAAGKVISAGWNGGYGNMVEIDHGNGLTTRYAHMSALLVSEDQWVEAGWVVGKLGSTGRSTGPHLHYEVRVNGEPVDPQRFLRAGARLVTGG